MVNLNGYTPSTSSPTYCPNTPSKKPRQDTTSPLRTLWLRNLPSTSINHHQPQLRTHNLIQHLMNHLHPPSPTIQLHLQRPSMPPVLQPPTLINLTNSSPPTNLSSSPPTSNQHPPHHQTSTNSPQQPTQHHHSQRTMTPPRPQQPTSHCPSQLPTHQRHQRPLRPVPQQPTPTNIANSPPPYPTSPPAINQQPPTLPGPSTNSTQQQPMEHHQSQRTPTTPHQQTSPSPIIPLQLWPLPPKLNIHTELMREWESAHRNSHTQAKDSMDSALTQQPLTYLPNKDSSSASTLLSATKSPPRLQLSHPLSTFGAQTPGTDAMPERSILMPRTPLTTANSSTTNGTHTPTTANSAGTQPLDVWKSTP